jgi:hypothetical protein
MDQDSSLAWEWPAAVAAVPSGPKEATYVGEFILKHPEPLTKRLRLTSWRDVLRNGCISVSDGVVSF